MQPLDPKWNEETLRGWAESHAPSGYVQARQVLSLLDEVANLRRLHGDSCKKEEGKLGAASKGIANRTWP